MAVLHNTRSIERISTCSHGYNKVIIVNNKFLIPVQIGTLIWSAINLFILWINFYTFSLRVTNIHLFLQDE